MPTAYVLPWDHDAAVELSRRTYRKQVLPKGTIDYKGRRITFDDAYLAELANAFVDRAFDQVPFVLADAGNAHTMDPERFRGEVRALEHGADGLYAIVEFATDEAAAAVLANPSLGVSARIVEDYDRADGKTYPRAIQHVLGTLDPRVTGMKPWEAVNLARNVSDVVDLTSATIEKGTPMEITAEQRAAFDAYLTELAQLAAAEGSGTGAPGAEGGDGTGISDEDLDRLLAEAGLEDELAGVGAGAEGDAGAGGAALSAADRQAIELANARAEQARQETARLQEQLDLSRFEQERLDLARAGVPPAAIEDATPFLLGTEHVVDLANGQKADAGAVVRKLLGHMKGTVDLSGETLPATGTPAGSATQAILDRWSKQAGDVLVKS